MFDQRLQAMGQQYSDRIILMENQVMIEFQLELCFNLILKGIACIWLKYCEKNCFDIEGL